MLDQLRRTITAAVFVGAAAIVGCSSSAPPSAPPERQKVAGKRDRMATLAEYEATLNPSDYDQEVDEVKKQLEDERPPQSIDIPVDTTSAIDEIVQGFRIQIFSTANIDEANAARESAVERFIADSIYTVFDPPVYKVRVGDFLTRFDASSRLQEFLDMGYRDAWIVPDRVVRRGRQP